ncbi:MAG: hypothetical protein P0Y62_16805 [Candidatus Chryseobacterium colombiense]|nr:hypothetical protein [Chryseobacterium sp.]WEK69482.1 MAG: hypothetical protein P0Y62_16805 [Chryseobacterium sp.]
MFTIITASTFFLSNSIVTWELNRGKLYICQIYSRFNDETYQKPYVNQILKDDNKVFHDWINCDILVPGNLIPSFNKAEEIKSKVDIWKLQNADQFLQNTNNKPFDKQQSATSNKVALTI